MNQHLAFLFPGQGSQYASMGKIFEGQETAKPFLDTFEESLSYSFQSLTDEELSVTRVTQPVLYTLSCIHLEYLKKKGWSPNIVAGHSLGEYAACYAAEVFTFKEGLDLVAFRGQLMHEVSKQNAGKMAAIIGLSQETVFRICHECSSYGIVEAVNINSEKQIVISGENEAVNKACEKAKEEGARRAIILPVSAPFHSSLMKKIREVFANKIKSYRFRNPKIMIVQNIDACVHQNPLRIQDNLILQLYSPVYWMQSMQEMKIRGAREFVEVGPKKVLSSLAQSMGYQAQSSEEILKVL